MRPRDITGHVLAKPLRSPYGPPTAPPLPRWLWLAVGIWLLYIGVFSDHSFWRIARLRREIAGANAELVRVRERTAKLDEQVRDPRARRLRAEEIARTQQGWAAPGEIVYRFREGAADSSRR